MTKYRSDEPVEIEVVNKFELKMKLFDSGERTDTLIVFVVNGVEYKHYIHSQILKPKRDYIVPQNQNKRYQYLIENNMINPAAISDTLRLFYSRDSVFMHNLLNPITVWTMLEMFEFPIKYVEESKYWIKYEYIYPLLHNNETIPNFFETVTMNDLFHFCNINKKNKLVLDLTCKRVKEERYNIEKLPGFIKMYYMEYNKNLISKKYFTHYMNELEKKKERELALKPKKKIPARSQIILKMREPRRHTSD